MKLCNIYNSASHYRQPIYLRMDKTFDCAWAFGERSLLDRDVKTIPPCLFKNFLGYLKNRRVWGNWYWQHGALPLIFKDFDTYLIGGEPFCLSTWVFCALAKLIPGKRVFFWSHGWYGRETFVKRMMKKVFFRLGDGVFLYGNYARELMIKEGFSAEKLWTIHNSLAYDEQLKLRNALKPSAIFRGHFENENRTLVFVGRLTQVKRLDMILDAMAILRGRGLDLNLALIGDGVAREELTSKARELGLEKNVWFYGACYEEDKISELMYNADLCVSPGNIGLTAMHALMFGCPCITHDDFKNQMPEFEAVIPGKTGAFFERGNIESLADSIEKWFSESSSREYVRRACYAEIDEAWNQDYQIKVLRDGLCAM